MSLFRSIRSALRKYADFTGRANRRDFWYFTLFIVVVLAITTILDGAFIGPARGYLPFEHEAGRPLSIAATVALFLPFLSISVRRLHDFNRSGWWILLAAIPVAGVIGLLVWFSLGGNREANRYGEPSSRQAD